MASAMVHIFRILDHCGCSIRASFAEGKALGLEYFVACDRCGKHLSKERYMYYGLSSLHEIQMYPLKILLGTKGWIEEATWRRIVLGKKIPALDGFEAARRLRDRFAPPMLAPVSAVAHES